MLRRSSSLVKQIWSKNLIRASHSGRQAQEDLDEVYNTIRAQRFEDIVVIQTKFNANPRYLILASAFHSRHLMNGTEKVNKHFKTIIRRQGQDFAQLSISSEWNVLDFDSVVVHLFAKKCREQFDIEQLWAVGERYDDLVNMDSLVRDDHSLMGENECEQVQMSSQP